MVTCDFLCVNNSPVTYLIPCTVSVIWLVIGQIFALGGATHSLAEKPYIRDGEIWPYETENIPLLQGAIILRYLEPFTYDSLV